MTQKLKKLLLRFFKKDMTDDELEDFFKRYKEKRLRDKK